MLTPTQLARITNIHPNSVRNWSRDFGEFFSPYARGEHGPRLFTDTDVDTMRVIATLKKAGMASTDITQHLRDGDAPIIIDLPTPDPALTSQHPPQTQITGVDAMLTPHAVQSSLEAKLNAHITITEAYRKELASVALTWFIVGVFCTLVIVSIVLVMGQP